MPTKNAAKATKIISIPTGILIGTMVVGAGLATAGWWFSDRLNLAFGSEASINAVSNKAGKEGCTAGSTGTNTFTDNQGYEHIQQMLCVTSTRAVTNKDGEEEEVKVPGLRIKEVRTASGIRYEYIYTYVNPNESLSGKNVVNKKKNGPSLKPITFQSYTYWSIASEKLSPKSQARVDKERQVKNAKAGTGKNIKPGQSTK